MLRGTDFSPSLSGGRPRLRVTALAFPLPPGRDELQILAQHARHTLAFALRAADQAIAHRDRQPGRDGHGLLPVLERRPAAGTLGRVLGHYSSDRDRGDRINSRISSGTLQ